LAGNFAREAYVLRNIRSWRFTPLEAQLLVVLLGVAVTVAFMQMTGHHTP
jgi:hypothetical protein